MFVVGSAANGDGVRSDDQRTDYMPGIQGQQANGAYRVWTYMDRLITASLVDRLEAISVD